MIWGMETKHSTTAAARFNPGHFASGLTEQFYPKSFGMGLRLGAEKTDLVNWLRKKFDADPASMGLAARLEACKLDNRCHSAACPRCAYAAQLFTTEVVGKFLANHPDRSKIVCVTVVPVDGEIAKGKLAADHHARNIRRWKEALGRAGVSWFLGATDWSFNEHIAGRYPSSWQEHFYGFTITDDPVQLKKELKKQFPASDSIPRPVKVTVWDGDSTAIAYMLKPTYWRRIGTDDGQRIGKDSSESRECRATDKQPLKAAQKHELLMHLDKIGIQGRLLMRWLQFVNVGGTGWTVVDRAPKGRMPGNGGTV